MNKSTKKLTAILAFLLIAVAAITAEKSSWQTDDYNMSVFYNAKLHPGDALFVRMIFTPKNEFKNQLLSADKKSTGKIQFFKGKDLTAKALSQSDFYRIKRDDTTAEETILAGVPLNTYVKTGQYTLNITYSAFGKAKQTFTLPVEVIKKDFELYTLNMPEASTKIRNDNSKEKQQQIAKLNDVLGKRDTNAVYELNAFQAPTPAKRITSTYGERRVYVYTTGKKQNSMHYGKDFGIPTGSEVRACAHGKVVLSEWRITTGYTVVIEHLPQLYSLYYHNSELKCKVGDIVEPGDLISISGATGFVTGPHLHWEIRMNWEAVDPDFFISDFTFEEASKNLLNQ